MSRSRDVSNVLTIGAVRRMALTAIEKLSPAEAPEDNFFVNITVDDGVIILTTGGTDEVSSPAGTLSESELKKMNKGDLIDLILS